MVFIGVIEVMIRIFDLNDPILTSIKIGTCDFLRMTSHTP